MLWASAPEASGVKTPHPTTLFVVAEAPTSEIRAFFKLGQHPTAAPFDRPRRRPYSNSLDQWVRAEVACPKQEKQSATTRSLKHAERNSQSLRAATDRAALGETLGGGKTISRGREGSRARLFHRHSAAERHRLAAHRPHAGPHRDRYPHALAPHAAATTHCICRARTTPGFPRSAWWCANLAAQGNQLPRPGPRRIRATSVGVERGIGRHDHAADAAVWAKAATGRARNSRFRRSCRAP